MGEGINYCLMKCTHSSLCLNQGAGARMHAQIAMLADRFWPGPGSGYYVASCAGAVRSCYKRIRKVFAARGTPKPSGLKRVTEGASSARLWKRSRESPRFTPLKAVCLLLPTAYTGNMQKRNDRSRLA